MSKDQSLAECSVGVILREVCHKLNYDKVRKVNELTEMGKEDKDIIMLRTGITNENATICNHHVQSVLKRYSEKQQTCCDPFDAHKASSRKKRRIAGESATLIASFVLISNIPKIFLCLQYILSKEMFQKTKDMDKLMELVKEKMRISNRSLKIQLLTLVPSSWSRTSIKQYFPVTDYMIRKSRKLFGEKGILGTVDPKKGRSLDEVTTNLVKDFYCNDEYSRQMPGKKDFVSVSKNVHIQKRLLLCNLSVLYAQFRVANPNVKISFSMFCSLRPKWCITVGSSGAHSVCMCTSHQNVILMVDALKLEKNYKELTQMIVCDPKDRTCTIHRCKNCPGTELLRTYLEEPLCENNDEEYEVTFKQWTTVDRAELVTRSEPITTFLDILIEKLDKLTAHSFIARAQSRYLNKIKDEVIVLGDFAENYQFVVQDEIQSFHWNVSQCTLHPIVIYFKHEHLEKELLSHSLCFISNDLNHDVDMVYEVISQTIQFIKTNVNPQIKLVHYFSDGCAGQYKNCKNFLNICHHYSDFNVNCIWSFFATSHGKSPCDGIGGTVKWLTARASLQRPVLSQILDAEAMFEYCQNEIAGITSIFISSERMKDVRKNMVERYTIAKTVPGTRSFHCFVPINQFSIGAKRVSEEDKFQIVHNFKEVNKEIDFDVKVSQYVVCRYDGFAWIGFVQDKSTEERDVKVKFMHPHFPSSSYHWPYRDDQCWVPDENILAVIAPPTTSSSGRQYQIMEQDNLLIASKIHED